MASKQFPLIAIQKDTTDIKTQLRKRRIRFAGSIELTGPPESFKDLITMETVEADGDAMETVEADGEAVGPPREWTRITIRDRILSQE